MWRHAADHADPTPCAHQGQAAAAELAALVHRVAGLLGLLLTLDAPPAAEAQSSIDRSAAALPVLIHVEHRQGTRGGWQQRLVTQSPGHQRCKVAMYALSWCLS